MKSSCYRYSTAPVETYATYKDKTFNMHISDLKFELSKINGGSLNEEDKTALKIQMINIICDTK